MIEWRFALKERHYAEKGMKIGYIIGWSYNKGNGILKAWAAWFPRS